MSRADRIRTLLEQRFAPQTLDLQDESAHHAGHAGAREGAGHYRLRIVAAEFAGLPKLQRHRKVYEALGDLMQREIHALSIEALAPDEARGGTVHQTS